MWLLKLTIFVYFSTLVHSYNILGLFPHPGKSHIDVFLPLMKSLARKGHNITMISHFPLEHHQQNYVDIDLNDGNAQLLLNVINVNEIRDFRWSKYAVPLQLLNFSKISCTDGFKSYNLQNFLKSTTTPKYDIIITELFNTDCFMALVNKFPAPIVGFSSSTILSWYNSRFGVPSHPAYIPNNLMSYSDRMTFFERVENAIVTIVQQLFYDYVVSSSDEQIVRKYFGRKSSPLSKFCNNMSLMLVNTHFSYNLPRPLVPNVVEVGGIHIGKRKPLPKVCIFNFKIC